MKNGTRSNSLKLVDNSGQEVPKSDSLDVDALNVVQSVRSTLAVLISVSTVCMMAAIASGSYAIWLAKRQETHEALTDVSDILKMCQLRIRQLETEVQQLPESSF